MRNGPVLWRQLLDELHNFGLGQGAIIAGGAIRDFVMKLGEPKDIDIFVQAPPNGYAFNEPWTEIPNPDEDIYQDNLRGILAVRSFTHVNCNMPVQIILLGDNSPTEFVKGFDLGTSKCYYRGSVVLGKEFLDDWHHAQISILSHVFHEGPNQIADSRKRARRLALRYPHAPRIVEMNELQPVGAAPRRFIDPIDWNAIWDMPRAV